MRVHLVAIGGSVMHNLALDLAYAGHSVTGSDDEFYEPSRSRLEEAGILPAQTGWFPEKITTSLDCVIAGMHAKGDNPEIAQALELGIRVYSFPEFFGEHCKDKLRVVVAGSHGKTTTTAMIMHALKHAGRNFDYLIGAAVEGFERNVRLSDADICIIEGDEYPSSPLDLRPKIMHYDPDIAIITGVAWDHMNVFPTWESYVKVFRDFIGSMKGGKRLIWYAKDSVLQELVPNGGSHLKAISYQEWESVGKHSQQVRPGHDQESTILDEGMDDGRLPQVSEEGNQESTILDAADGTRVTDDEGNLYTLKIFGQHNLENMMAAWLVSKELGISEATFLKAMQTFSGAAMRLQLLYEKENLIAYRDFAHAPSKVKATVQAIRQRYPAHFLVACFELHTYSSLNTGFLPQYQGSLDKADHAIVFFSPKTLEIKKMAAITATDITNAFAHHSLEVDTSKKTFEERLTFFSRTKEKTVILLMSSGRFENADLDKAVQASS